MKEYIYYTRQMQRLAVVGADLCAYMPDSGDPSEWPNVLCDCKFVGVNGLSTEITGCAEVRQAWRVLSQLRDRYPEPDFLQGEED